MTSVGIKMGMTPPHPGAFIRIEALEELGLSVSAAARILGVRRATLSEAPRAYNGRARSRYPPRPDRGPIRAEGATHRATGRRGA